MTSTSDSNLNNAMVPQRSRPIFDGLTTDEDKFKAAMAEYNELKDVDGEGMDFANKTSMWIAYERDLESRRDDKLFVDPLAKHFAQPYGKRLSDSMSHGLAVSCFDPTKEIGLGLEGHVLYTAARTKLINDQIDSWMTARSGEQCQVVNLGAGLDTRQYWLQSLTKATLYWEIDTPSVMNHKQSVLDQLKVKNELPDLLCSTKSIAMDFSKESIADLPTDQHGFDTTVPTCWILEGLIMYLTREAVEQLLDTITNLSAAGSLIILNFSTNMPSTTSPNIDEIDERLCEGGWKKNERLMFGDDGFNFGRYPTGKPSNKMLGFAMYSKE